MCSSVQCNSLWGTPWGTVIMGACMCLVWEARCYEFCLNLNGYRANKADLPAWLHCKNCSSSGSMQWDWTWAQCIHSSATDAASTWGFGGHDCSFALGIRCPRRGVCWEWPQFCIMGSVHSSDGVCDNVLQSNWALLQNTHVIQNERMPSSRDKDVDKVWETIAHLT